VKRARQRGIKTVRLCQEIITLPGGQTYTCGHHTKNPDARCTMHRPPPGERVSKAPAGPPHLAPPLGSRSL
jgi:hypothetical protein